MADGNLLMRLKRVFIEREMNARKIIALALILVIYAEWFPFFAQITMNFMVVDFRDITTADIVLIATAISSPLLTFILSLLAIRIRKFLMTLLKYCIPVVLIIIAVGNWLNYMAYYQFVDFAVPNLEGLPTITEIVGLQASFSPYTKNFMLISNALQFSLLVPMLLLYASDCRGFMDIDQNVKMAVIVTSLYMVFRFGGIIGATFRLAILAVIAFAIWGLVKTGTVEDGDKKNRNETIADGIANRRSSAGSVKSERTWTDLPDTARAPLLGSIGIFMTMGVWMGAPSLLINGLLYNTWVWIFLFIGTILGHMLDLYIKKFRQFNLGIIAFIVLGISGVLVLVSGMNAFLVSNISLIIVLAMLMIGLLLSDHRAVFLSRSKAAYMRNPVRFLFLYFFMILGYLLPFVSGAAQPLTNIASVAVYASFFALSCGINLVLIRRFAKHPR